MAAMTIQQIYDYANELSEESLGDLASTIMWMNEAQDLIARFDHIQATPATYTLTTNEITLPSDFMMAARIKYEGQVIDASALEIWSGVMSLPDWMTTGDLKLYYYRKPAVLLATTPGQVPDVAEQYHGAISYFVVSKYHEVDDDQALAARFSSDFMSMIQSMKMPNGHVTNYYNY